MFFTECFPQATVPIRTHVLEDHGTLYSTHVRFGCLGPEFIHAKCTGLSLAYTAVTDKAQHLLCIVKEHLISIEKINLVLTFV